jgi:uncharacterized protein (TIGR02145 family)
MNINYTVRFLLSLLILAQTANAQIGIGTTTPVSSAELDVSSTTKGFLPPRMTHAQKLAIVSPIAGLGIWCSDCGSSGQLQIFNGSIWTDMIGGTATVFACGATNVTFNYAGSVVTYGTVSSAGSKCWLDRNLGATQIAATSTDANSYGDLFQWGRAADGHQRVNRASGDGITSSSNTALEATVNTDSPSHGNFILTNISTYDWRIAQNNNLWNTVIGTNNPCPSGYRIPTEAELETERLSWGSNNNATGAFASPLKLPMAGYRSNSTGGLGATPGIGGYYWSSTTNNTISRRLYFHSANAAILGWSGLRAIGMSVRCIKN